MVCSSIVCASAAAQSRSTAANASVLPAEIPLFPLPETSRFPGVSRPFPIFEPRYRAMIADARAGDKIIGMVRLRPGFESPFFSPPCCWRSFRPRPAAASSLPRNAKAFRETGNLPHPQQA